jgi:ornithine cyclodeaminase
VIGLRAAADAIERALTDGVESGPARIAVDWAPAGELLVMPARHGRYAGVKLATVAPQALPRIKGVYVLFDADTLAPLTVMDGAALTTVRTPAVSAVAARHLAPAGARRLVVFGRGPQAQAHVEALAMGDVTVLGRGDDPSVVHDADVICCCTSSREPLFDSSLVRDDALVIAIGSHTADARELDEGLMNRATVVVESIETALTECGDVIQAGLEADSLVTLEAVVRGEASPPPGRPRVFKSAGMAWEDLAVAAAAWETGTS